MSPVKSSLLDCPVPAVGDNLLKPVAKLAVKCKNSRLQLQRTSCSLALECEDIIPQVGANSCIWIDRTTQAISVGWTKPSKHLHAVAKSWGTDSQELVCSWTHQYTEYLKAFDVSRWYPGSDLHLRPTACGWEPHSDLRLWLCPLAVIAAPCDN